MSKLGPLYFLYLTAVFIQLVSGENVGRAIANIQGEEGLGATIGHINFTCIGNNKIRVIGKVTGLKRSPTGLHGFHIHQYGDQTMGCNSSGAHFNPYGVNHGGRDDSVRHVGDLGNIPVNTRGEANINFVDDVIALNGDNSIIGRSIVIHASEDDLGRGTSPLSKTTGNSGARIACGVIGRAMP